MSNRKIHLRFPALPSGLASYPRVVLTRRPDLLEVTAPTEFDVRVDRVGDEQRQVEGSRSFDAARHTGGSEPSLRRDAAFDRRERHVRLQCGVSHAGIASVRSRSA